MIVFNLITVDFHRTFISLGYNSFKLSI